MSKSSTPLLNEKKLALLRSCVPNSRYMDENGKKWSILSNTPGIKIREMKYLDR